MTAEGSHRSGVVIDCVAPVRANIASCAQRDLYRKYRWPAAKDITSRLEVFKEEYHQCSSGPLRRRHRNRKGSIKRKVFFLHRDQLR